jgi:2,4-diaminopentanoate dehydrogenase
VTSPLRVIQWGTGGVGVESLRLVLGSADLELVGLKCHTDAKHGVDAGRIAGLADTSVLATQDREALLALDADCVLFMPRDAFLDPTLPGSPSAAWVEEIVPILQSGKNVVSPIQSGMHWRQLANGEALRNRLASACADGESSLFFTGLDPGFVSDCLAITMSSAVGEIAEIRTWEVIDYATYAAPYVLYSMGFGQPLAELGASAAESLIPSWGGALWLVAESLGVELDEIILATEGFAAPEDFTSPGGALIRQGTVGALKWSLTGVIGGVSRIVNNHVARIGEHMAPDWLRIGERGGYRVEIAGSPPVRGDFPLGLPGGTGTCVDDAVLMTAARCVNAIASIVAAPAGYHLLNELPIIGGRHSFRG